jgi:hypothetical protein
MFSLSSLGHLVSDLMLQSPPLPSLSVKLFSKVSSHSSPFYFENAPLIWSRFEGYPPTRVYVDFV